MDFHSLLRRDLQFLCKRNKIPANLTNVAMADALSALEIVEGLSEYMNQFNSSAPRSPTSVAKQPPNTATRTTRRKTSSCHLTSKSLAGEMDQEPKTNNVKFESNVPKTPVARSTRKGSSATSCSTKVQESKKGETVQSVYSTRRSTRLLEKCMADMSLKTKETLDRPAKNEDTKKNVSAQEKNPADSEAEVIPGRDLTASMEKEWEIVKNDSDQVVGDVDLGDITVFDANTETNMETTNVVMGDEKESNDSLIQVVKLEETSQANKAICEEGPKKNDIDQEIGDHEICVDLGDIHVVEYAINDNNESKNDSEQETEHAIPENDSESEEMNNFNEDTLVNQTDSDACDSETEPEEDKSCVDSVGAISEADSNKAIMGSDEEMILSEAESCVTAPTSPLLLEEAKVKTTPLSPFVAESISIQFPRPNKSTTPSKKSALKLINVDNNKENNMEMMVNVVNNDDSNGESKGEEAKKKKKVAIDEENLKDVSMRQLVKMVKELSINSSKRTALQILPGNSQILE